MSDGKQYDVNKLLIEDFFKYSPSLALAITSLVLFTLLAALIGWLTERRKQYRFTHCITVTGLLEAGGYAALIYGIVRSGKGSVFNAYVAMQVLVVLSPNVIQAAMYWQVGLILAFSPLVTRGRRWLRAKWITWFFCLADLFAITVQAVGISIWANSKSSGNPDSNKIRMGCGITLAGLFLQLGFFAVFTTLTIWSHRHPSNGLVGKRETRRMYIGLYTAMAFLTVRNLFRLVEFMQSTILTWPTPDDTYVLAEKEVLFYTLDTLPILICLATYCVLPPGFLLPAGGPPKALPSKADAEADLAEAGAAAQLEASARSSPKQSSHEEFKVAVVSE